MKIKFINEQAIQDFLNFGSETGEIVHNRLIVEMYKLSPFEVVKRNCCGYSNKSIYIADEEMQFFEIIEE